MKRAASKKSSPRPAAHSKRPSREVEQAAPGKSAKAIVPAGAKPLTLDILEVLPPVGGARADRFALVNEFHEMARLSMAQSCAYMILAGVELLALKEDAEHGTWEKLFADHRSGKSRNVSTFGFSYDSARNYMRLATAAKKHVPALRDLCSDNVPLALMPAEKRDALVSAVRKAGDGKTYGEAAAEWGLAKKPPGSGAGGTQTPAEPEKKLTPQQAAERAAQDRFHKLSVDLFAACSDGEKQKLMHLPITSDEPGDVTGLTDLCDHARAFLRLAETALEQRKKAARNAK